LSTGSSCRARRTRSLRRRTHLPERLVELLEVRVGRLELVGVERLERVAEAVEGEHRRTDTADEGAEAASERGDGRERVAPIGSSAGPSVVARGGEQDRRPVNWFRSQTSAAPSRRSS
jgi:hypothetical protein